MWWYMFDELHQEPDQLKNRKRIHFHTKQHTSQNLCDCVNTTVWFCSTSNVLYLPFSSVLSNHKILAHSLAMLNFQPSSLWKRVIHACVNLDPAPFSLSPLTLPFFAPSLLFSSLPQLSLHSSLSFTMFLLLPLLHPPPIYPSIYPSTHSVQKDLTISGILRFSSGKL